LRGHGSEKGGFGLCANKERKGRGVGLSPAREKDSEMKKKRGRRFGSRPREKGSGGLNIEGKGESGA
jgi:hypothetical protein